MTCVTTMGTTIRARMMMPIRIMQHIFYGNDSWYFPTALVLFFLLMQNLRGLFNVVLGGQQVLLDVVDHLPLLLHQHCNLLHHHQVLCYALL